MTRAESGGRGRNRARGRIRGRSGRGADGPFDPSTAWNRARYLVLDSETTGLDPRRDHLLSLGWVCVDGDAIVAGSARHCLVRPPGGVEVGHSATLHHITDSEAATGVDACDAVGALLADLEGRVLVCHFAQVELGFVGELCRREWGSDFEPSQVVDTLDWHRRRAERLGEPIGGDDLRLNALIRSYGLVRTRPHHALSDAFATALVFVAMAERVSRPHHPATLADLL